MSRILSEKALVLNKSWTPIATISLEKAFRILFRETASVVCHDTFRVFGIDEWIENSKEKTLDDGIKTSSITIRKPEVIILKGYSRVPKRTLSFTRNNLFKRDEYTCQYCSSHPQPSKLTIDHVVPRKLGGISTWENCVLACNSCNSRKADKTLSESGFQLLKQPRKPDWTHIEELMRGQVPESWKKFLPQK